MNEDKIFNPISKRYVKINGKKGKELQKGLTTSRASTKATPKSPKTGYVDPFVSYKSLEGDYTENYNRSIRDDTVDSDLLSALYEYRTPSLEFNAIRYANQPSRVIARENYLYPEDDKDMRISQMHMLNQ
jgi:hypothetical protein